MENKRFYRSNTSTYIGGVCGGIADYFNIDPVLVRIIFILFFLYGGAGVLIYLILWIVTPKAPIDYSKFYNTSGAGGNPVSDDNKTNPVDFESVKDNAKSGSKRNGALIGGIILVATGTLFLLDNIIKTFSFHDFWPVILVILGVAVIFSSVNNNKKNNNEL